MSKTTEEDLKKALEHEDEIKEKFKKGALSSFQQEIQLMFNLLKDYRSGAYREVSWGTIAHIVHLLYIPVIGPIYYAMVAKLIRKDLEKYKQFRKNKEYLKNQKTEEL
jgi:hypothetical protein